MKKYNSGNTNTILIVIVIIIIVVLGVWWYMKKSATPADNGTNIDVNLPASGAGATVPEGSAGGSPTQ